ncbi:hypothetical protein [Hymenobacter sp. B81]|uniref:hypothetical protein n=1 Tax=Hymenobacter sp. B81 TaxID=3344878 RepID=UPI0037DD8960
MTRYFLVLAAALLPLGAIGQSKPATASATAQLESEITAEVCRDFEKQHKVRSLDQLSKDEAMTLMQEAMKRSMMSRAKQVEKLMKDAGDNSAAVLREMGQRVGARLASECPVALALFTRLAGNTAAVQSADLTIGDAERPLLTRLATAMCTDLTAVDAQQPLSQMSKEARTGQIQQSMQKVLKDHAREVSEQYGPELFMDADRMRALGIKVGGLMAGQCPKLVATFGQQ